MKLTIDRDQILDALGKVQSIVGTRSTIPILANVLFQADGGEVTLTTTDLDLSIRAKADADVNTKGGITLPAKRAYSLFRELPQGKVEIDVDDSDYATIKCGSSKFKLVGISEDDFPPLPKYEDGSNFTIEQAVFKDMLKKTGYAASFEESRPTLNGLLVSLEKGKLTVVATDSRRLAMVEHENIGSGDKLEFILPNKAVNELQRVLKDEGSVTVFITDNQVAFQLDQVVIVSKIVDGQYPNFRLVIPAECKHRVTVEREILLDAVKRASLLTSDQSKSVKMIFQDNRLTVSTETPDVGNSEEKIPVKYDQEKIAISFNPDFVLEPLRNLVSDEIFLELTDDLSPALIKSDIPFLCVLMPLRIN